MVLSLTHYRTVKSVKVVLYAALMSPTPTLQQVGDSLGEATVSVKK